MNRDEEIREINLLQAKKVLLEIEFAIAQKNSVTAVSNRELQVTGAWQNDWHKVQLGLDDVIEQAERKFDAFVDRMIL